MLESSDHATAVTPQGGDCTLDADELNCQIQVPREWLQRLDQSGPLPAAMDERRRFPRFHYPVRAVLYYRTTFPDIPRPDRRYVVLTQNISREGISFLHEEQLFPQEQMQICLSGEKLLDIEVFRCAKINDRCFEIGARMKSTTTTIDLPATG